MPDGVFNVVHGDKVAVDAILEHPDIAAVSFVGSTPIARYIYETATKHGKRVQALGGAKNHMIVLPDADIELAADAAVGAALRLGRRALHGDLPVVAVGDVGDELVAAIKERMPKIKVGNGLDEGVEMGPLVTAAHRDKVAGYVEGASARGRDGRRRRPRDGARGATASSSASRLLDDVHARDGRSTRTRSSVPCSASRASTTYDEAHRARQRRTPTATARRSSPATAAPRASSSSRSRSGMVGVNVPIPVPIAYYSFGGWKAVLFGDTHIYGPEGIHFYTRGKVVTSRWPDPATSKVDLGFPQTR